VTHKVEHVRTRAPARPSDLHDLLDLVEMKAEPPGLSDEGLWDVMDHYNKGDGLQDPYLDEDIQPLALTEDDIDDVVAFLASLTSAPYKDQGIKELARQRELSRTNRPQRDTARAFGPKPHQPQPPRP